MFELIGSYKGLVISLILVTGDLLKIELFDDTCAEFWDKHIITHERKIVLPKQNHYFHTFNGEIKLLVITVDDKRVVGHYCTVK
jgi:hypothetical protein